jgi:hypothetical protein
MNKIKIFFTAIILSSVIFFNLSPLLANAAVDLSGTLDRAGGGIYGDSAAKDQSFPVLVGKIIKVLLGTLGVILVCIMVYAGYLWMTAGGEEKNVEKAKSWIKNGIIGMVIIMSAYVITTYVMSKMLAASIN